ncbi:hypothetical protein PGB90_001172 [Kerria lacca]
MGNSLSKIASTGVDIKYFFISSMLFGISHSIQNAHFFVINYGKPPIFLPHFRCIYSKS